MRRILALILALCCCLAQGIVVTGSGSPGTDYTNMMAALRAIWNARAGTLECRGQIVLNRPVFSPPEPDGSGVALKMTCETNHTIRWEGGQHVACLTLDGVKHGSLELGLQLTANYQNGVRCFGISSSYVKVTGTIATTDNVDVRTVCGFHLGYYDTYRNDDICKWTFENIDFCSMLVSGMNTCDILFLNPSSRRLWFADADPLSWPSLDHAQMLGGQNSTLINFTSSWQECLTFPGGLDYHVLYPTLEATPQQVGAVPTALIRRGNASTYGQFDLVSPTIRGWGGAKIDWIKDAQATATIPK